MTLIQIDQKTATVAVPVTQRARLSVPRGIVPAHRVYNGEKVNDMPALWPYDELRTRCIDGMKKWVARRQKDGDELLTAEADIKVFGPYRSRAGTYHRSSTDPRKPGALHVTGYGEDEDFNDDLADFVFEAQFLTRRHRPVQTRNEA